jgi:hypothetical protein
MLSQWTAQEIHILSDKTKAIITKFVAPFAVKQVLNYVKEAHFISIMTDSCDHLNVGPFFLVIRYHPEKVYW